MNERQEPAFAGLKVIDFSQAIAGPYGVEILVQNGAEVIKVEPPAGDWGRTIGYGPNGMSAIAVCNNLGKRSICIDGSKDEGRKLMRRLCDGADIVVESFRPGVMDKLGLSYTELSAGNPALIYVSVTAFGSDGPYAKRPGSDSTLQALSGLMVANKDQTGMPRKVGILLVDVVTGIYTAQAISTALYRRATTGKGGHVRVSLLESVAAVQGNSIVDAALGGGSVARPVSVPAGTYKTADGFNNVTALHDKMFAGICRAVGREEWLNDPSLSTAEGRFANADKINQAMISIFATNSSAHWLKVLSANEVVCGIVAGYPEFLADSQVKHAQIFQDVKQPGLDSLPVPRVPGTARDRTLPPAPTIGQHTKEVLLSLGLAEKEIARLAEAGAIGPLARA